MILLIDLVSERFEILKLLGLSQRTKLIKSETLFLLFNELLYCFARERLTQSQSMTIFLSI